MASPIEESFLMLNLKGEPMVFEFGCSPGRIAKDLSDIGYKVVGVDLYEPDIGGSYKFIKGDIIKLFEEGLVIEKADNVIAISSIEHCGIETDNFRDGNSSNMEYHKTVASLLSRFLKDDGVLIVTVPFGDGGTYYVDRDGNNGTIDEIKEPAWGFRTFNKDSISDLFPDLALEKCVAYKQKKNSNYFNIGSWELVSLEDYREYNNKDRAVMCCVFKQRRTYNGIWGWNKLGKPR